MSKFALIPLVLLAACATTEEPDQILDLDDRAPTSRTLHSMATILQSQGRFEDQEFLLKRIIHIDPEYRPAYNDLAGNLLERDRREEAIKVLEAGIAKAEDDPVLHNNLGMCYLAEGRFDQGLSHFVEASFLAPSEDRFRANQAMALALLGREEEAKTLYAKILDDEDDLQNNIKILRAARRNQEKLQAKSDE